MKIDLHVHTNRSFDGRASLEALAARAALLGLDGLCICDHNLCSLTEPLRRDGVMLYPCTEVSTTRGHITGLFLEAPLDYPTLMANGLPGPEAAIAEIHRCGGAAVLAHPFASGDPGWEDAAKWADGAEAVNARADMKNPSANRQAADFAAKHEIASVGGSDAHSVKELGNAYTVFPDTCQADYMPSLRAAMAARAVSPVSVAETAWRSKGASQFAAAMRSRSAKRIGKGIVYLGYCTWRDLQKHK
ncbi:MAG: PHP domain-containing protein [Oscillospiraceae bacterium]|nr:PHP domain-containing protein [Oscillospiraceae bacterium]